MNYENPEVLRAIIGFADVGDLPVGNPVSPPCDLDSWTDPDDLPVVLDEEER